MLNTTAEYALRIAVFLAEHPERPFTAAEISARTQVPNNYLYKVIQNLVRAGYFTAQRGQHGGVRLQASPQTLTLYDVVDAVSPFQRIRSCPLGLAEHKLALCALHQALDSSYAMLADTLKSITLAQLIQGAAMPHFPDFSPNDGPA
jgi:Rrf2 family nitric oxide-sensitive transcriptional repressor